jgi:membrane-bound serine protease (ClpP class)
MDFLLDPNIAYVILVVGFLLGVFALLTPGTGFFELGAFFGLVIAAWAVFTLPINIWALVILLASIVPFLFALRQVRRQLNLGLSAVALAVGSAFLFRGPQWWIPGVNPILALIVSISAGGVLWLMAAKMLEAAAAVPTHDLQALVGQVGEARTRVHHNGSVQVFGELWSARSATPIKAGEVVRVTGREGLILEVELLEE